MRPQDSATATRASATLPIPDHELLRPIASGSYGEVWLARNAVGTFRAVKIVRRDTFEQTELFDREFRGLQKFEPVSRSHDGLVDILQIGRNDAEGWFYYVMELADAAGGMEKEEGRIKKPEGSQSAEFNSSFCHLPSPFNHYAPRTLRADLKARGAISAEEATTLALELTAAIAHLHAQGLVHRDIKPSNILFVGSVPKLADAGLVAAVDDARSLVGTAGYIAPEGPGSPQADLYALGKVLYEAAFGKDRQDFPQLPPDLRSRPDHARLLELNAVLLKACATNPRERYVSAEAMQADLMLLAKRRSVRQRQAWQRRARFGAKLGLAAAVVSFALWLLFARFHASTPPRSNASTPATIFVLPFRNDATNQVDELIRSRITDAVTEGLALFDGVNVRPRKSSWSKLDNATLLRRAAGELGARFVVTGEGTQSSNRLGLTLRLLQTPDGRLLAQDTVGGDTNNLAALELAALELMAKHLGLAIDSDRRRQIEKKLTGNVAALDLQRQGVHYFYLGTREGNASAIEYLSRAVELDSRFVEAHMALAATYHELAVGDRRPKEMWAEIRKYSVLALEIDDTLSLPRYNLAWGKFSQDHDWHGVMAALQPLIEDGSIGANGYAGYLRCLGRLKEARREQDRAELEDSRNLFTRAGVFNQAFFERDYARAIQKAQETIAMYPHTLWGYDWLAQCHIELGEFDKALGELEAARRIVDTAWGWALTGYTYARMGRRPDAAVVLDRLRERAKVYVSPYCFALVYTGLGQDEAALDALERAYDDQCEELFNTEASAGLRTDPRLKRLRDHPRLQALLKKVGLDEWPK